MSAILAIDQDNEGNYVVPLWPSTSAIHEQLNRDKARERRLCRTDGMRFHFWSLNLILETPN
jgi:hypothetical protein